ncbi:MAG: hypothetical protein JWR72_3024 [Flavisolibacter sp.]|jgi:hypothetical protein|nr:hypothetical protein [Flavisolibacter sp.]
MHYPVLFFTFYMNKIAIELIEAGITLIFYTKAIWISKRIISVFLCRK